MKRYEVFQQRAPIKTKTEGPSLSGPDKKTFFEVNLVSVGEVRAANGHDAIEAAREMPEFKAVSRRSLSAFPIVQLAY